MNKKHIAIIRGRSRGNGLSDEYPCGIEILLKKAKIENDYRTGVDFAAKRGRGE